MRLIQDPTPYFRAMFERPEIGQLNFMCGSFVIQAPGSRITSEAKADETQPPPTAKQTR
jgi:hypothetical protein